MTSAQVAYLLQQVKRRREQDSDLREMERQFYAAIHNAKYEPQLSDTFKTMGQQQELAETSKETDAKIEAHMQQRMADMKAKATTKRAHDG